MSTFLEQFRDLSNWYSEENQENIELRCLESDNEETYDED